MAIDLNKYKKAPSTTTPSTSGKIDLNKYKKTTPAPTPEKKAGIFSKVQEKLKGFADTTTAGVTVGTSRLIGSTLEGGSKLYTGGQKLVGSAGKKGYETLGNVFGFFGAKETEKRFDEIGRTFKEAQDKFVKPVEIAGADINRFISQGGQDAKEILLKDDADYQKSKTKEFSIGDLKTKDFWEYKIYNSLLENAPTMLATYGVGGATTKAKTIAGYLSKVAGSTAFGTSINAIQESETQYSQSLKEGLSKEEAIDRASRVFERNAKANIGLEGLQLMLVFAPQLRTTSKFLSALANTSKVVGMGTFETIQERVEDEIQNQSGNEDFDFAKLVRNVTSKQVSETDVVSFIIGMMFGGAGNVVENSSSKKVVEKAFQQQVQDIADRLPEDPTAKDAEEKVFNAIEKDPQSVSNIAQKVLEDKKRVPEELKKQVAITKLPQKASQMLAEGMSETEVKLELSKTVSASEASNIVNEVMSKQNIETAPEVTLESVSEQVTALEQKLEEVKGTPEEKGVSSQLNKKRKELSESKKTQTQQEDQQFLDESVQTRTEIQNIVNNYDVSPAQAEYVENKIAGKYLNKAIKKEEIRSQVESELSRMGAKTKQVKKDDVMDSLYAKNEKKQKQKKERAKKEVEKIIGRKIYKKGDKVSIDGTEYEIVSTIGKGAGQKFEVSSKDGKSFWTNAEMFKTAEEANKTGKTVDQIMKERNAEVKKKTQKEVVKESKKPTSKKTKDFGQPKSIDSYIEKYGKGIATDANNKQSRIDFIVYKGDKTKANIYKIVNSVRATPFDDGYNQVKFQVIGDNRMIKDYEAYALDLANQIEEKLKQEGYKYLRKDPREVDFTVKPKATKKKSEKKSTIQGLKMTESEIVEEVKAYIENLQNNNDLDGLDFEVVEIRVVGSRTANIARKNSDLDVLLEYKGKAREDDMFNALNENKLNIDGIEVDINPIKEGATGTMKEVYKKPEDFYKKETPKKSKRIGLMDYDKTYTPRMNELIKEAQENGDTFPYLKMTKEEQAIVDSAMRRGLDSFTEEKQPASESKVPDVLYHGTTVDFDKFDSNRVGENTEWDNAKWGFFFIDDKARAQKFVEDTRDSEDMPVIIKEAKVTIKNPIDFTIEGLTTKEDQAKVVLEILGSEDGAEMTSKEALAYLDENIDLGSVSEMYEALYENIENKKIIEDAGYDGIVSEFGREDGKVILEYVAFNPEQIEIISKENLGFDFKRTKTEIRKSLTDKMIIFDKDGANIQKISQPQNGLLISTYGIREEMFLSLRDSKVITDSYILFDDKAFFEKMSKEVYKKYPNLKTQKPAGDPIEWSQIVPNKTTKAEIQGYYVDKTGKDPIVNVVMTDGTTQKIYNADKVALVLREFPDAVFEFGIDRPATIFKSKGKMKGLVMNIEGQRIPPEFSIKQPTTKATTPKQEKPSTKPQKKRQPTPETKIEDVGEKIGGARKDILKNEIDKLSTNLEDGMILKMSNSEAIPKFDYKVLAENGVSEDAIIAYNYFKTHIGAKPRKAYRLSSWLQMVKATRVMAKKMLEGVDYTQLINPKTQADLDATKEAYEKLDYLNNPKVWNYTIRIINTFSNGANKTYYTVQKNGKNISYWNEEVSKAIEVIDKETKQEATEKKSIPLEKSISVFRQGSKYFIAFKRGSKFIELETFSSLQDAREAKNREGALEEYAKKVAEAINFDQNSFRVDENFIGERPYRDGDVTAEQFAKEFGFRAVEFGNWVNQAERQERLNLAYDSFKDLASILGVPDRSISLNGQLAFAFGSRGKKGALAHYEPDKVVINLTKQGGAGTIAHEWWHALDNYLSRREGMPTRYISEDLKYSRKALENAFTTLNIGMSSLDVYARSKKADAYKGSTYYSQLREVTARGFEVYVNNKLKANNIKNGYLVNLRDFETIPESLTKTYPYAYGEEIEKVNQFYDNVFNEIQVEDSPTQAFLSKKVDLTDRQAEIFANLILLTQDRVNNAIDDETYTKKVLEFYKEARAEFTDAELETMQNEVSFKFKDTNPVNEQVKSRHDFLREVKERWNLDFDVYFVDEIFAGIKRTNEKDFAILAYGAELDSTIVLASDALENTDRHEVVHLTLENAQRIPIMVRNGITREKVHRAQAEQMGIDYDKATDAQKSEIEERIAIGFETYRKSKEAQAELDAKNVPKGIIAKFYKLLYKLIAKAKKIFTQPDAVKNYYELLDTGREVNAEMTRIENKGVVAQYINENNSLDIRDTKYAHYEDERTKRLGIVNLKRKPEDDKLYRKITSDYVTTENTLESLSKNLTQWKDTLNKKIVRKAEVLEEVNSADALVREVGTKNVTRKPPVEITQLGMDKIEQLENSEDITKEVYRFLEIRRELIETKNALRKLRKDIANAKVDNKIKSRALKDLRRRLKNRLSFLNRKYAHIEQGIREGRALERMEIREMSRTQKQRARKIQRLKEIYLRTKKATKTGAYLPIEYQKALLDIFNNYDFVRMTDKTKEGLKKTQEYFASQEGEVPQNIASKLERLNKIPVRDMTQAEIETLVETVEHIYSLGYTKLKLQRGRDERQKQALLDKVLETTINLDQDLTPLAKSGKKLGMSPETIAKVSKGELDTMEAFRVADILDGYKNYQGANFKELQEPVSRATVEAKDHADTLLAEALGEIREVGETFSEQEQARIVYFSALSQNGMSQAKALKEKYSQYDFESPITEKESAVLEIMRDYFKQIRPELAGTYESVNNRAFPDNPNYFPFKYDSFENTFDIEENPFDFSVTKTKQGFTMERQPQVGKVLDIKVFEVFARSINEQLYYAKVQPVLDTTKEIVNSDAYKLKAGKIANKFWKDWISDVAKKGNVGGIFDTIRGNISTAFLGYKLSTVLIQPIAIVGSLSNVSKEIGFAKSLKVFPEIVKLMISQKARDITREQSIIMREREGGQVEISEIEQLTQNRLSDKAYRRWYSAFKRNAFTAMKFTDFATAGSVFQTLKNEYVARGMSESEAIIRAENIMKLSQASTIIADRSRVMNSDKGRLLLTFQTFVLNQFNNVRHDIFTSNIKTEGVLKGSFLALMSFQFIVYQIIAEGYLRDFLFKLFYGEDDEEKKLAEKIWASFISNIPIINTFYDWDGNVLQGGIQNPVIQTVSKILSSSTKLATGDITFGNALTLATSVMTMGGVPATAQINQLIRSKFNVFRRQLGLNDFLTQAVRLDENVIKLVESGDTIDENTIKEIAKKTYDEYENKDLAYKKDKEEEVRKQIAIRKKFGADDQFIDNFIVAENNNEKKLLFVNYANEYGTAGAQAKLSEMRKPIVVAGKKTVVLSDNLTQELRYIARAPEKDREIIEVLLNADSDTQRENILSQYDKRTAFKMYSIYGVISKELYEYVK